MAHTIAMLHIALVPMLQIPTMLSVPLSLLVAELVRRKRISAVVLLVPIKLVVPLSRLAASEMLSPPTALCPVESKVMCLVFELERSKGKYKA